MPLEINITEKLTNRLLSNYTPVTESGCWLWDGYCQEHGYGVVRNEERKKLLAHRVSYTLYKGEISKGLNVCHKCDTPSCINPSHLFEATQKENLKDMTKKGRRHSGYKNFPRVLTIDQVKEIRKTNKPIRELGKIYNVSSGTIQYVKTHGWGWL